MTHALTLFQSAFASALFHPGDPSAQPLGSLTAQPAFAVYRNTVMKGCIDALEATFPSVVRLVGQEWFRAAAAVYVVAHPPSDGRMLCFGEGFADFLDQFDTARDLPYLANVARLDRCWTEAHMAADASAADSQFLATLSPEVLGDTVLTPHPAARWHWFATQPVYSLWHHNRDTSLQHGSMGEIHWHGEGALLTRPHDAVLWCAASQADCAFLDACATGQPLGHAAAAALHTDPALDLADLLARLLRAGALIPSPTRNP